MADSLRRIYLVQSKLCGQSCKATLHDFFVNDDTDRFLSRFLLYFFTLVIMGMVMPYNDPELNATSEFEAASGSIFMIAIQRAGLKVVCMRSISSSTHVTLS